MKPLPPPKFCEMNKAHVTDCGGLEYEGYVIGSQFRDGRWIYKLSISEDPSSLDPRKTFDNWVPEEWMNLAK